MDQLECIARDWSDRAPDLARWALSHMVNRTDVWGRYVYSTSENTTKAVTAPFRESRGKTLLRQTATRGSSWTPTG